MIGSEEITRAERRLAAASRMGPSPRVQCGIARVNDVAVTRLVEHHRETLRKVAPDLDPRLEPALNTIMFHMFITGALCGRQDSE